MLKYYKRIEGVEYCYYVDISGLLTMNHELNIIEEIIAGNDNIFSTSIFHDIDDVVEIGPQLNFETAFSSNAVSIIKNCGINQVKRIEVSKRFKDADGEYAIHQMDRMTEAVYPKPLETFKTKIKAQKVFEVPILKKGIKAFKKINKEMGLGMDEWDMNYYYNLFVHDLKRNPTNVECFQLGQMNSEHSRHWFFKGKFFIDGVPVTKSLMDIVKFPLEINPANSVIAFSDNSSGIKGFNMVTILPEFPGRCSPFKEKNVNYCIIFTAETHNFPTGVAPFPGAETGTGGRIRDIQATGQGGLVVAGTAGYCVGNLNIPGYDLPWENKKFVYPSNLAAPLKIEVEASNGASDYGNKFGEPIIAGFTRSFGIILPNGERREWLKPIMFTGGIGQIPEELLEKFAPETGWIVVQIGGPAYRIGIGGGAASSMMQGENKEQLDFNAVQRGDAEMKQKVNRAIRACIEMGNDNPILSVHDQGAGGPCNVLTELIDPAGGIIHFRAIKIGDPTLSPLEIWGGEYQERLAILILPERLGQFSRICEREKVNYEILGEITGDGRIVVDDPDDYETPTIVDLPLEKILGKVPQKEFFDKRIPMELKPLEIPDDLTVEEALKMVFALISVGSKKFLTNKVDRGVTGLIAQQQCVGPLQLPDSDYAIIAQSHFGLTGAVTAIGECPTVMLVNPEAGARMAVGEALTNLAGAYVEKIENIKCSANWMWPAKLPGETAKIYDAACAMRDIMISLGIAVDGGKDSLSMAAKIGEEIVKAPGNLVISAYATMPDITKKVTPDIKMPGRSRLLFIDLGLGKNRMGGSALAQVLGQIGDEAPDVDNMALLVRTFMAIQKMVEKNMILSLHDRSDGGFITTLAEMAMAGNCGAEIDIVELDNAGRIFPPLFSEELGHAIEYLPEHESEIFSLLDEYKIPFTVIGRTTAKKSLRITKNNQELLCMPIDKVRHLWEATSFEIEKLQANPQCAKMENELITMRGAPSVYVTFKPEPTPKEILSAVEKPKVAIIREEGSNGDREMTSAFYAAGFEPWDVAMTDLKTELTLEQFRGAVFVGGFSYADVFGSAKGWAATIKYNPDISKKFEEFFARSDTFSLGICNGFQLMLTLGWLTDDNINENTRPQLLKNTSQRFESRWPNVKIKKSPSIMLKGMEDSVLGVWIAHGEGRLHFPDNDTLHQLIEQNLTPVSYVDYDCKPTEIYPLNPNGSRCGITALCTRDGRHLGMMPHPERAFLLWQGSYLSERLKKTLQASPWIKMFQNAYKWCMENK